VIEDVRFRLMEIIEKALLRKENKIGYKRTSEQTVICEKIKAFVLYSWPMVVCRQLRSLVLKRCM
jgi:hypothetical protein